MKRNINLFNKLLKEFKVEKIMNIIESERIFNWCQLQQIQKGLEAGIDVSIYTVLDSEGKPVFYGEQMEEIRLGLERGLDVSVYTILNSEGKPVFNWQQMLEIREGLERGLDVSDVSTYTILNSEGKPVFDADQMHVIRYGLETGLDVSIYTILDSEGKPVFDFGEMHEIRWALFEGIPKGIVKQEIAKPELSVDEMVKRREKLDKELYKLGKEGLLEKYGMTPEKENSEVEKDENTLNTSEEISY